MPCTASDDVRLADPADASFNLFTSGEGLALSTDSRSVCDSAGNCTPAGPFGPYMLDGAAPTVNCDAAPDTSIWYNSDVVVPCTGSDPVSGLANAGDASFSLSTTGEGTGLFTSSRTVCDIAGNCAATVGPFGPYMVDSTAPTVTCGAQDTSVWYRLFAIAFCSTFEVTSGLANDADASFNLFTTGEGTGLFTSSRTVCDVAGNCVARSAHSAPTCWIALARR